MRTALFQNIFESSVEGILVVDNEGLIIKSNAAAESIFGYGKGELQNMPVETLIPEKYRDRHIVHRKNYAKSPRPRRSGKFIELWGLKKNGTSFPMDISLSPTRMNGKSLTITFLRDISERRATVANLMESERRLQTLIGNLPGFVYRVKNDRNYTAEYLSAGCARITGYPETDFISGKIHYAHIIFEKDREYIWNKIQKAVNKRTPFSIEYRILTKGGELKYIFEQGEGVYGDNGKVIALEGFIQDISDKILLQKTVKQKQAKNIALLEVLPDMMFILDGDGNYLDFYIPPKSKSLMPYDDVLGKNISEVLPEKVCEKILPVIQDTFYENNHNTVEYELVINQKKYYFEARMVPLDDRSIQAIVRDVTHRKNVENTLKVRTRALAAAGNGILIVDAQKPDYPIIYVNEAFTKITGYDESEVLGKNCRFLQCDDRDQEAIKTMKKAVDEGTSCEVVLRNYKKGGAVFYNELTITPVYGDKNELTHFIGVQNDVTERILDDEQKNQMRQALEMIVQERPMAAVIDKLIEIIEKHIGNTVGSVMLRNAETNTLYKMMGSNLPVGLKRELEGKEITAALCPCASAAFHKKSVEIPDLSAHPQWKGNGAMALQKWIKSSWSYPVFSSKKEVLGVFTVFGKAPKMPSNREKDLIGGIVNLLSVVIEQEKIRSELYQSRKDLAAHAQNLENEVEKRTGELKATLRELVQTNLNLHDQIIETKAAEHQAKANEALFSAIAKNFPKGAIGVVDANFEVIFIDGDELNNFGLDAGDIRNTHLDDVAILNTDQKNFIKESVRRTLSGGHLSFEIKFKGHSYAVNTTPLTDLDQRVNKALFVYSNITEHKRVELEILNALRKEQELNELKSRFVSMASHEFRTPLSTILSSATLIERQNGPGKEDKRLNYVSRIKSNVRNLVKILNDFLSLSRLEEGNLTITPEKFDLVSFLTNVIDEVGMNKKDGQTIHVACSNDNLEIYQDPKVVRLIINNLLSNAIKYSPKNTGIDIKAAIKGDTVHLQFMDRGMGIPPEDQKSLFVRFFRAQNASHLQGTGLGLYIVKQYVNFIGGTVGFTSREGKGTTFYVEFPVKHSVK